ncbi:MAG: hypothetical protein AAB350_00290 [Patescibacteria group bacterium]
MPRIQFSDVTPPDNRRSIRDIPIPNGGKRKAPINIKPEITPPPKIAPMPLNTPTFETKGSEITENKSNNAYEYYYPKNKEVSNYNNGSTKSRKKTWIFGSIIAVLIVIFIVGMMTVFASATVNITPRSQNLNVATEIAGVKEIEKGGVRYEVVKLAKSKTVSIPATGEEAVELKSSGKIIVYNNFSSQPQRLIIRTRFETKEGLIFRIPESIVVPGKTTKNGAETPGSIEVEVFADEPGEKYNIGKTDFIIPGFKSDPQRYNNFYARSATEMTGGFVGKMKTVLPTEKQVAMQNIDTEIQVDLEKELQSKVPVELVLLSNSIIYKSRELPQKEESSSVLVGKEITAYALMLNKKELSDKIIVAYASEFDSWNNIKSQIIDFSPLVVEKIAGNLEGSEKISLQIKGRVLAWAEINTDTISQKLLGAPKKDLQKIMDEFAGISSITAVIRPIWKRTFPTDSSKIRVQVVVAK